MTLLADENLDRAIVDRLRRDGHDVHYILESARGSPDEDVWESANRIGAVLLTADKGFGEFAFRKGLVSRGVILLRLAGLPTGQKALITSLAVARYQRELAGSFAVVTPGLIRVRRRVT